VIAEPFFPAPRRLRRLLEDGETTPTGFALLMYVSLAGADREDGCLTSYQALAELFGVSSKTVSRSLARLRESGVIKFDLRAGQRRPFRIRLIERPRTPPRTLGGGSMSEVVSEVTSDTTPPQVSLDLRSGAASTSDTTSDTSRERAETETEKENKPLKPLSRTSVRDGEDQTLEELMARADPRFRRLLAETDCTGPDCDVDDVRRWLRHYFDDPISFAIEFLESRSAAEWQGERLASVLNRALDELEAAA
jgi:DNA-binding transcriptional ArsR family regulator